VNRRVMFAIIARSLLGLLVAMTAALAVIPTAVVSAAATFTLTESSSTMNYGGPAPTFRGVLTLPSDDPGPTGAKTPLLVVGSVSYIPSMSGTAPTYDLYWSGIDASSMAAGDHSIYATYQSTIYGAISSNAVTLTVVKSTPVIQCTLNNAAYTYARGAPYSVRVGSEWAGDPFTIRFAGPQTFSFGPIAADSGGNVAATVPSVTGVYQSTTCIFDGTAGLNSASFSLGQTVVSLNDQPGDIALYTTPTPVTPNAPTTWRVVVTGQPGLATPTGGVGLQIGAHFTQGSLLLSGGSVTFNLTAPALVPTDRIEVEYYGDLVYTWAVAYFPLNPPSVPGSSPAAAPPPQATPTGRPASVLKPSPAAPGSPLSSPSPFSAAPSSSGAAPSSTQIAQPLAAAVASPNPGPDYHYILGVISAIVLAAMALATWRWRVWIARREEHPKGAG